MKALKLIILCMSIFLNYTTNAQIYFTQHDEVIDKLIPKAKKNKLNDEKLALLTQSYHQANQEDHQKIMELKASGQPDIWGEIYFRIKSIESRQNKIATLPENIKTAMNFKALNLDKELSISKEKTELYICAKTNQLFKVPTEENILEAAKLIGVLEVINPQSNNLDELNLKLIIIPSRQILFRIATPTELSLPENFAQLALDFDEHNIYGVPFDIMPKENTDYDLMIRIMIEEKRISPERIDAVTFEEKNGDKVAKVTDKTMSKTAAIIGQIEFIDVENEKILINTPFDIASTFVYHYAEMSGDKEACSEQTLKLLLSQPIDFPSYEALFKDVARKLNAIIETHYQK